MLQKDEYTYTEHRLISIKRVSRDLKNDKNITKQDGGQQMDDGICDPPMTNPKRKTSACDLK